MNEMDSQWLSRQLAEEGANASRAIQTAVQNVELEYVRPVVVFKPKLIIDGNAYGFIFGETPISVEGWGATAYEAARNFDAEWYARKITSGVKLEGK